MLLQNWRRLVLPRVLNKPVNYRGSYIRPILIAIFLLIVLGMAMSSEALASVQEIWWWRQRKWWRHSLALALAFVVEWVCMLAAKHHRISRTGPIADLLLLLVCEGCCCSRLAVLRQPMLMDWRV